MHMIKQTTISNCKIIDLQKIYDVREIACQMHRRRRSEETKNR